MKIFICDNINGRWVGANAVIVAETKRKAKNMLVKELKNIYLWTGKNEGHDLELEELDTSKPQIIITNDGEY